MDEQPNAEVESAVPSAEVAAGDAPAGAVVAQDAPDTTTDTETTPPPRKRASEDDVVLLFKGTFDQDKRPLTYVSGLPAHDLTRAQVSAYIGSAATLAAVLETGLFVVADGTRMVWPAAPDAPAT